MTARSHIAALGLALLAAAPAQAQGITLAGRMGERALIVLDGQSLVLGVGQTAGGVKLLRWQGDTAVVEQAGVQFSLRVGAAPARMGGGAAGGGTGPREIVIAAGPGGHFVASGSINGQAVRFLVDTGATLVAVPRGDAERLGLDLRSARTVLTQTAAGPMPAQLLNLQRVRVGEVELLDVPALVTPASMPFVLLGNSFLTRFQMRRDNDVMRLELR